MQFCTISLYSISVRQVSFSCHCSNTWCAQCYLLKDVAPVFSYAHHTTHITPPHNLLFHYTPLLASCHPHPSHLTPLLLPHFSTLTARTYELALTLCGEGLLIDKDSKKLLVEMHLKRAKVHKLMAKNQTAKAQAAPSSSSGTYAMVYCTSR